MRYSRIALTVTAFLLLTGILSWLLLNTPAEITLTCRSVQGVDLKIYPSLPFERKIGKKSRAVKLAPSSPGSDSVVSVKIPLKCLRKIRLEVPPGADFELIGGQCRMLGFLNYIPDKEGMFPRRADGGLALTRILYPGTDAAASLKLHTSEISGRCEIRLVSDYPRLLAVRIALLISAVISFLLFHALERQKRMEPRPVLLIVIFMAVLLAGSVFVGLDSGSSGRDDGNTGEAAMTISDYPARFSQWYQRNLPFRDSLYSLHYRFCRRFGISPVKDVIFGQDDWLFIRFASQYQQTPYEDYSGNNLFTPRELQTILQNLIRVRDALKKRNIRFCIFIAPGKLHVYGHKLPQEWRRNPGIATRGRQLVDHIRKNSDIPVGYPLDEFAAFEKKIPVPLYYKHDTHWNFLGAYIGARSMMRLIDPGAAARMPEVSSLKYQMAGLHRGDIARMIEAPESFCEPNWKFQHPSFDYTLVPTDSGCYSYPGKSPRGKRVFFIRDSFMMGMAPFLKEHFSHLTFYWDFSLNPKMISEDHPDIVVLEIVDRYLAKLISFEEVSWRMGRGGRMM